jgi:hypothetical protein
MMYLYGYSVLGMEFQAAGFSSSEFHFQLSLVSLVITSKKEGGVFY